MATAWQIFVLLFWKNWLLQRRHCLQTIAEVVAPLLFSLFLIVIRLHVDIEYVTQPTVFPAFKPDHLPSHRVSVCLSDTSLETSTSIKISEAQKDWVCSYIINGSFPKFCVNQTEEPLESAGYCNCIQVDKWVVLYTPKLQPIEDLMRRSATDDLFVGCSVDNSTELVSIFNRKLRNGKPTKWLVLAGIEFNNMIENETKLPMDLKVSLRFPGDLRMGDWYNVWFTHYLHPMYQTAGPRTPKQKFGGFPVYNNEGFLALQSAVSSAFINLLSNGSAPEVDIFLQRFPFPPYANDPLLQSLKEFIPVVIVLSFVYSVINTVRTITQEKESQIKEAMKIMGLPNWIHWIAWFFKTLLFFSISITIIAIIWTAPIPGTKLYILPASDFSCILVFLFVYIMASVSFCFAISALFSKSNIAAVASGLLWYFSYIPYDFLKRSYTLRSMWTKILSCLLPNTAMSFGFRFVLVHESTGMGLQWSNIWKAPHPSETMTLGHIMLMLLWDCVMYFTLAVYVESLFPGDYGVPRLWHYPFSKSFWIRGKVDDGEGYGTDIKTNEKAGIVISNLRKVFPSGKVAVQGLNLTLNEGEIAVLLGHNGAGKTTTMSILTGLYPPTSGTAYINGCDIRTNIDGARESIGLCPQFNVLFEELTVREHLDFFGKLKGLSGFLLCKETARFLEALDLEDKADAPSSCLSGGLRRKLAVALALCGGSKVILLDEPTSGMDPSARRSLWDLLQREKADRTILLTTHYMDEADILGDQIAVMSDGQLQCVGSSFSLKKEYGGGYNLILVKDNGCDPAIVTAELSTWMPGIAAPSEVGSEMNYHLDDSFLPQFERLFEDLEQKKSSLRIKSYGVSLTTMEEVFVKIMQEAEIVKTKADNIEFGEIIKKTKSEDCRDRETIFSKNIEPSGTLLEGWCLLLNQIVAMWYKNVLSLYRSWFFYIVIVLLPVMNLFLALRATRSRPETENPPPRGFSLKEYDKGVVVMTASDSNHFASTYGDLVSQDSDDIRNINNIVGNITVSDYIYRSLQEDIAHVTHNFIIGTTFGDGKVTSLFNNQPYHVPPLALSYAYNAILRAYVSKEASITIVNHPMPYDEETMSHLHYKAKVEDPGFLLAYYTGFSYAFVFAFFSVSHIRERICKAKLLQFVCGVNVVVFWVTAFLWDNFVSLGPIMAVILFYDYVQEDGYRTSSELERQIILLFSSTVASLPLTYLASLKLTDPAKGFALLVMAHIVTGVVPFIAVTVLKDPNLHSKVFGESLGSFFTLFPAYSLTDSLKSTHEAQRKREVCATLLRSMASNGICIIFPHQCCQEVEKCPNDECLQWRHSYFDYGNPGVGYNIFIFYITAIVFFAVLLTIEHGCLEILTSRRWRKSSVTAEYEPGDEDVRREFNLVNKVEEHNRNNFSLLVKNLSKRYDQFHAVKNLSFAVTKGECFGLLGANGAGKTTTFKILTGDERVFFGEVYVKGMSLKHEMKQVRKLIGYCPQFDAILDDLTGRETLRLICLIRGVPVREIEFLSSKLADELLFSQDIDKKVRQYSGGNRRKLSIALALIGDPPVIYLDEPTTGMDPMAKRRLRCLISNRRVSGKTTILTSHSMEECEALCTRVAIMVNGELKCIGSVQHLKDAFAKDYTLTIKIKRPAGKESNLRRRSSYWRRSSESDDIRETVKEFIENSFRGATLAEDHKGLLTFRLPRTCVTWANMFGTMEEAKDRLNIEDYSLGQTSLEQVFLSFTLNQDSKKKH